MASVLIGRARAGTIAARLVSGATEKEIAELAQADPEVILTWTAQLSDPQTPEDVLVQLQGTGSEILSQMRAWDIEWREFNEPAVRSYVFSPPWREAGTGAPPGDWFEGERRLAKQLQNWPDDVPLDLLSSSTVLGLSALIGTEASATLSSLFRWAESRECQIAVFPNPHSRSVGVPVKSPEQLLALCSERLKAMLDEWTMPLARRVVRRRLRLLAKRSLNLLEFFENTYDAGIVLRIVSSSELYHGRLEWRTLEAIARIPFEAPST
ncbi:hypothetical protein [Agrococcus pavilionensis]|uniref:hypothetical protein n=1 Tax=Agrococcus pavilionensis TaxID=1346502 RepID=UPI001181B7B0|nr:hypothetical protein [Agrococcus pavilionensis]